MRTRASSPLPWLAGLLALYLLVPIVAFVVRLGGGVSSSPGLAAALETSVLTATIATAVVTLLGTPLAYLMARMRGVAARATLVLVALPLALPALMSGVLLLYVVGPLTIPGRLFGGKLTDTRAAIVLAQVFVAAPFLIIAARAAFAAVDPALEDVASTLGHGPVGRFARVAVPAALPGIVAGILLTWLRAFAEFGATIILAYHPLSLPVFTYVQFDEAGLPGTVLPVVAALSLAVVVLLAAQVPLPRRRAGARAAERALPTPPGPSAGSSPEATIDFALAKRLGDFSLELSHASATPRLALLGPSGAGKTLTLRLISGLTKPRAGGHVRLGDRALDGLAPEHRGIGYVPQQSALMPRRTVWGQVTFGVGAHPGLAAWWLGRLGLEGLEDRYPEELSGGQQRRVALARALATAPRLLLLDEPFTGLDAPVRDGLRRDLRRLQREAALSTVIVTHDPEEAAMLAEEILVIDHGHLLQVGTRRKVFRAPASPTVAELLGIPNTRRGRLAGHGRIEIEGAPGVLLPAPLRPDLDGLSEGSPVIWSVRPERILLDTGGPYEGILIDEADLGAVWELTVSLAAGLELTVRTADLTLPAEAASSIPEAAPVASDSTTGVAGAQPCVGEPVRLSIDPAYVSVWPDPG